MSTAVIPEPIAQLQRQLDQIRSTQPRGKKLPDSVWQAAVELAREHGVYSVAHPLRLDYTGAEETARGSFPSPTKSTQAGVRRTDGATFSDAGRVFDRVRVVATDPNSRRAHPKDRSTQNFTPFARSTIWFLHRTTYPFPNPAWPRR